MIEEKGLLARLAKPAGAGKILNIHLKGAPMNELSGTQQQPFGRHGWRKLMPRPFHAKRDIQKFAVHNWSWASPDWQIVGKVALRTAASPLQACIDEGAVVGRQMLPIGRIWQPLH